MLGEMTRRFFSETEKQALLADIGDCRKALIAAEMHMKPFCDEYKACDVVIEAIDRLAGLLTGDPRHFHLKGGAAAPVLMKQPEGRAEGGNG